MKLKIYAVRDKKAKAFLQPSFLVNEEVGLRSYEIALKTPGTIMNACPEDFELYCLGDYNEETGVINSCVQTVIRGIDKDVQK